MLAVRILLRGFYINLSGNLTFLWYNNFKRIERNFTKMDIFDLLTMLGGLSLLSLIHI